MAKSPHETTYYPQKRTGWTPGRLIVLAIIALALTALAGLIAWRELSTTIRYELSSVDVRSDESATARYVVTNTTGEPLTCVIHAFNDKYLVVGRAEASIPATPDTPVTYATTVTTSEQAKTLNVVSCEATTSP